MKKVFKNKKLTDLYSEIYDAYNNNDAEIKFIIEKITSYISNTGDALLITPMLQGLLSSKIRNSGVLLDLTRLIQRQEEAQKAGDDVSLMASEQELMDLLKSIKEN